MSKKQIKAMIDRSDYKTLDGPFMAGLAANKDFAEMSCKEKTKEDDNGKDVAKTSIMMKVQPSARSKYFDHTYVKNLPDTDECKKLFLANVPSFADSALAAADAAYVATRDAAYAAYLAAYAAYAAADAARNVANAANAAFNDALDAARNAAANALDAE